MNHSPDNPSPLGDEFYRWFCESGDRRSRMDDQFELGIKAKKAGDLRGWFRALREIHRINEPEVERGHYDPYIVDWGRIFTPIEEDGWYYVRTMGLKMFPQYPVGRFFVDFGDPWKHVAIECDGQQWHNAERDAKRDRELADMGWRVLHLSGSELFAVDPPDGSCEAYDDDGNRKPSVEAAVRQKIRRFLGQPSYREELCSPA